MIINVLLIEDSDSDAALIKATLNRNVRQNKLHEKVNVVRVRNLAEAVRHLTEKNQIDLIMTDLALPDSSGVDTVKKLEKWRDNCPIVVITGRDDEELMRACISEGAFTYLYKGDINGNVRHSIIQAHAKKLANIEQVQKIKQTIKECFPLELIENGV